MAKPQRLHNKYDVKKSDGSPVDPSAVYFVLRIDSDKAARCALFEYALHMIAADEQDFAADLLDMLKKHGPFESAASIAIGKMEAVLAHEKQRALDAEANVELMSARIRELEAALGWVTDCGECKMCETCRVVSGAALGRK